MAPAKSNQGATAEVALIRVFLEDSEIERRAFCVKDKISIGRCAYTDIMLEDPTVSRLHCVIRRVHGHLLLEDMSSNGTSVNGRPVKTCGLASGDVIVAGQFTLIVEVHQDSRTSLYDQARVEGWEGEDEGTIAWVHGTPRRSPTDQPATTGEGG